MPTLYGRKYRLTVNDSKLDTVVQDLRVSFSIKADLKKEPNEAEVRVFNCNADTVKRLEATVNGELTLEAGYESELGIIFKGTVTKVLTAKANGDVVTTLQAHSGLKQIAQEKTSIAIAGATDINTVFKAIAAKVGGKDLLVQKALAAVQSLAGSVTLPRGFAAAGTPMALLNQVLAPSGLTPSIQNGELLVVSDTSTVGEAVLNSDSGLIGSPSLIGQEKNPKPGTAKPKATVKAKSLLRHVFQPGVAVQVTSTYLKGRFRIESLSHSGDSHGANWTTELYLYALD